MKPSLTRIKAAAISVAASRVLTTAIATIAATLAASAQPANIALNRQAWASSSFDYNMTPQLVTDGIVEREENRQPIRLDVWADDKPLPRDEREWAIGGNEWCHNVVSREIRYRWKGMSVRADQVRLVCYVQHNAKADAKNAAIELRCNGANLNQRFNGLPGQEWGTSPHSDPNKRVEGVRLPTRRVEVIFDLKAEREITYLALAFKMKGAECWRVNEIQFLRKGKQLDDVLPSRHFRSVWLSDTDPYKSHWLKIDLGEGARVDSIIPIWVNDYKPLDFKTSTDEHGILTLTMTGTTQVALSEVIVHGKYGKTHLNTTQSPFSPTITRGADSASAKNISRAQLPPAGTPSFATQHFNEWQIARLPDAAHSLGDLTSLQWLPATVPGSVLMSYVNAGAVPDPNFANHMERISESFFLGHFCYRTTFKSPSTASRVFLNLEGINWKAEVSLNGSLIGRIDGAFRRGRFDITSHLRTDADNELLIHIIPNDHPGAVKTKNRERTDFNGGILGADNPTFHSNVGWDWIPTVRGRNIGIWGDVNLSLESDITLLDPLVTTVLDDSLRASVTPSVRVANNTPKGIIGNLSGSIAGISFSRHISIAGNSTIDVSFSPDEFPQLAHCDLPLWWPNGMGAQHLHDAHFVFTLSDAGPNQTAARTVQSDTLHYKAGLRELSYAETDSRLQLFVNHRRVHPIGGNWGFPEQNLRYTSREYDIAVRLHKEMNFNMIRNWVGQTPHRAFYEACDRYGILIWQDFWLANPADGPNPSDNALFMDNADDYVYRIRRHPSIALYCGRNEGYPPAELDSALRLCVSSGHPQLLYISSSADDGVSGHGPYWAVPRAEYFTNPPVKLHTERGMPNVMNIESLRRTLAPEDLWPQGDAWGQHDYCQQGAQRGSTFNRLIENYGHSDSAAAFCRWAQWLNYEGHRAMFEADNVRRQGLLMWMSHPCWPSMTWQTYDYFFDTPAAFFAIRKACEPLHIQFDSHRRRVQAVAQPGAFLCPTQSQLPTISNTISEVAQSGAFLCPTQSACTAPIHPQPQSASTAPIHPNPHSAPEAPLTARALILSREGRVEAHYAERVILRPDTTIDILHALNLPTDTATHFLRLQLITPDTRIISDNTYLYNAHSDNYTDLTETLPPATLKITQSAPTQHAAPAPTNHAAPTPRQPLTIRIENTGDTPALMIRLKLLTPTGTQILPAHFSDNYFHLFPRETRTITVLWNTPEHPTAHVEAEWTNR